MKLDLVGQTFRELTVLARAGSRKRLKNGVVSNGSKTWDCLCSCGVHLIVDTESLRSGNTKSCGHKKTHCPRGHAYTPENTYSHPNGSNGCRICRHELNRDRIKSMTQEQRSSMYRREALRALGWTQRLFDEILKEQKGL